MARRGTNLRECVKFWVEPGAVSTKSRSEGPIITFHALSADSRAVKDWSYLNMENGLILRWLSPIVALLTCLVSVSVALTPDGLALLEFKNGLTTTSPLLEGWSASDLSPCAWGGIICTANGEVQNISLPNQVPKLEGNISASL